ncbi:hypothetical protein DICPUDRAFT_152043 [Dictyostelium purpureum]|uniref:phosphoenolpyruvate carboxykinase (ATP) n=1 Tax=Dictyostelium purpureum TaxID=5786 RepID=F0ZKB9_DICPU|nr:uncharacterized protein DICPUDRAFT_152043 [Dictyostelium purpureum]EGC35618.1 hypothetical protein DICPUDRAFT_152043 [Dictyostelium purpureum]|eukprot:XP_003287855.1 hypothetical protein DICPUDRAFT_152043 [Dictyostelium purpureum]
MISSVTKSSTLINSSSKLINSKSFTTTASNTVGKDYIKSIYGQLRRKRDRRGLVNVENFEESEITTFPRSREGLDYDLNWTLNGYSITPSESAYRNPRLPLLFQQSNGKTDKNFTLTVNHNQSDNSGNVTNYYLDEAVASKNSNSAILSIPNYKEILEEVKSHISSSKNIYVHDAAVGSSLGSETTIRAVTNDSVSSLFLKHLLPNTTPIDVSEFKHNLTLYFVPNYQIPNADKLGLKTSSFNIIDVKRGIAVVSGVPSTENVRNVITAISSSTFAKTNQDSLTLSADIYSNGKSAPVLVFSEDGFLLNKNYNSGKVVSQGSIWSADGVSRLYNSITYNFESIAKNQYDLIEKFSDKKINTTVPVKFETNHYNQPSSIVFIIKDTSSAIPAFAQLTGEQAKNYFVSGFVGNSDFVPFFNKGQNTTENAKTAEVFENLIKANNTKVYIINPAAFDQESEVDNLLGSVVSGKVADSTNSDVYNTLSPIKVPTAKDQKVADVKKAVKTFETKLKSKVESLLQ